MAKYNEEQLLRAGVHLSLAGSLLYTIGAIRIRIKESSRYSHIVHPAKAEEGPHYTIINLYACVEMRLWHPVGLCAAASASLVYFVTEFWESGAREAFRRACTPFRREHFFREHFERE